MTVQFKADELIIFATIHVARYREATPYGSIHFSKSKHFKCFIFLLLPAKKNTLYFIYEIFDVERFIAVFALSDACA